MGYHGMHAPPQFGVGVRNFRNVFAGEGSEIYFVGGGGGGYCSGGGGGNFVGWATEFWGKLKEILKLHNASIKSISRITNLIYFRDIWKLHLLISEYVFFNRAMTRVFEPLLFFQ